MPWVRARAGPRASALHQCTLAAGDNALPSVAVRFPGLAQRPGLSPHGYPADNSPGGQERGDDSLEALEQARITSAARK